MEAEQKTRNSIYTFVATSFREENYNKYVRDEKTRVISEDFKCIDTFFNRQLYEISLLSSEEVIFHQQMKKLISQKRLKASNGETPRSFIIINGTTHLIY